MDSIATNHSDSAGTRKYSAGEHTPGPWRVSGNRQEVYAKDPNGFTGPFSVADCSGAEPFGPLSTRHPEWVAEANARLIAAAPDLLEALKRIRDARDSIASGNPPSDLQDRQFDDWAADIASAAIARAEGRAL